MLTLTALVGASVFVPVPRETALQFYSFCIAAELSVALAALVLEARASCLMVHICALMVAAHAGGLVLDGSDPLHPYRLIIKFMEFSQLLACVALSPVVANILRNKHATTS